MIVTLTHQQARSVGHRVSKLHRRAMLEHRTKHGRTQHDYDLPAIAWRQILDEMQRVCFGPMGGKLDRGVPKSAYSAIKRIADGVRRIENHPALKGRAVEGWVGDVVPVWRREEGWSPYPREIYGADPFRVMWPLHGEQNGMLVTGWEARDPAPNQRQFSLRIANHLMFVGADARSDAELLPDEFSVEDLVGRQPFGAADGGRVEDV